MSDNKFRFGNSQGLEQKLIDFDNIQRRGTIVLKPLRLTRHRNPPDISFRCFFNTKTGVWHGIPIGKNPDGTYKFKPIRISGSKSYSLENDQDAMEWAVVKDYYRIKGGAMERDAVFEVDDQEKSATEVINRISKSRKAIDFVMELKGNKLIEFGRLFGIDPHNNSELIITRMLMEKAESKPTSIIEKIESERDTEILIVAKRALATGIIKHSIDRGYVFKDGIPMGTTEQGVIEFLRKDTILLTNIDTESKDLDRFYKSEKKEVVVSVDPDEDMKPKESFLDQDQSNLTQWEKAKITRKKNELEKLKNKS